MFDTSTLRSMLPPTERLGEIGLRLLITALVAFVLVRLLFLVANRIERLIERARRSPHSTQRARTLGGVLKSTFAVLIGAAALIHSLDILGWDVGPLLAGAGVLRREVMARSPVGSGRGMGHRIDVPRRDPTADLVPHLARGGLRTHRARAAAPDPPRAARGGHYRGLAARATAKA